MKKSLFIASFLGLAVLTGSVPVIANAQAYYGNYSTYGASQSCLTLTAYQQFASTDAQTGGQVSLLQEFLNQTGYLSGVSGTYDAGTVGAVINFQNAHGIQPTGTVGPATMAAINAQSCAGGYNGYTNSTSYSYPVTNYGNGSNCYWSGTYNSTYVCRTSGTPVVYPAPIVCNNNYGYNNGYNSSYNNSYYENQNNCGGYNYVQLNSLSANYSYNTTTITVVGTGFSASGNTVDFGNSLISNVYSSNGNTLTFSVPAGYYTGTYSVTVTNAQGRASNALSFIMNANNGYYGNSYNGNGYNYGNGNYNNCGTSYYNSSNYNNGNCYQNVAPTLSSVTGPSNIQVGESSVWNVAITNSYSQTTTLRADWGDGSSSIPNVQGSTGAYGNNYAFSHIYNAPGVYTLRVTATSNNGLTSYANYTITVGQNYNNGYNYNYSY